MKPAEQQQRGIDYLVTWLEQAKLNSDRLLDNMVDPYAIVTYEGRVLDANRAMTCLFDCDDDDEIPGRNLSEIFSSTAWEILRQQVQAVWTAAIAGEQISCGDIELDIEKSQWDVPRHYSWSVRAFPVSTGASGISGQMACIVTGCDVTDLRRANLRWSSFLGGIQLGVLCVSKDLKITELVSNYANVVFGSDSLVGRDLIQVLFHSAWSTLSAAQKEAIENLRCVIGFSDFQFEINRDCLPGKFYYPAPAVNSGLTTHGRWLGLSYIPIVINQIVESLLVIVEDRSAYEDEARRRQQETQKMDEAGARFSVLRILDTQVLQNSIHDLSDSFGRLKVQIDGSNLAAVMATVHGIKGITRICKLERLMGLCHDLEETLEKSRTLEDVAVKANKHRFPPLFAEWDEVRGTAMAILHVWGGGDSTGDASSSPGEATRRPAGQLNLTMLGGDLDRMVHETAQSLRKDVHLHLHFQPEPLSSPMAASIKRILVHLVSNAIDHGIEERARTRLDLGKTMHGNLYVRSSRHEDGFLVLEVEDDGCGLDLEEIRSCAVRRGTISMDKAHTLKDEQVVELLFLAGFSTSESVSKVSGRGVGLNAVRQEVDSLGGTISVQPGQDGVGTVFQVKIRLV